jgi:hypothetical protein
MGSAYNRVFHGVILQKYKTKGRPSRKAIKTEAKRFL